MTVRETPFVRDALTGKRITPWWLSYILVVGVFILGTQSILTAALSAAWPVVAGSPEAQLQESITFAGGFLGLALWVLLYERRSLRTLGFHRPGAGLLTLFGGVVVGVVLNALPTLLLWATGAYVIASPPAGSTSGLSATPMLLLILLLVLVQSGTEETLTRGFLLQSNAAALPGWLAVLLPALVFTLVHGVLTKPLAFGSIFLFALLATFLVLRQGGLWIAIGIHAGWNFAMGNLFGVSVSGLPPHSTSVIFLDRRSGAPDWLTGGEFGTEAGLPAVVVLAVAAAVAFLVFRAWDAKRGSSALEPV